jgi:hypothetical protein
MVLFCFVLFFRIEVCACMCTHLCLLLIFFLGFTVLNCFDFYLTCSLESFSLLPFLFLLAGDN